MSACPEPIDLSAWLDGELEGAVASRITLHAADCAACSRTLEGFFRLRLAMRLSVGTEIEPARSKASGIPPWLRAAAIVIIAAGVALLAIRTGGHLLGPGTPVEPANITLDFPATIRLSANPAAGVARFEVAGAHFQPIPPRLTVWSESAPKENLQ